MKIKCMFDRKREGSTVPVHGSLGASKAPAGCEWTCLVVGERERRVAAGGVLKSTSQFAFGPDICLCNRQPSPRPCSDEQRVSNPPFPLYAIVVTIN